MNYYRRNRNCHCTSCRMSGMMGPAVLIALGVSFLLDNLFDIRDTTIVALLLIVIGGVKLLQHGASREGHIPPGFDASGVVPPVPSSPESRANDEVIHG